MKQSTIRGNVMLEKLYDMELGEFIEFTCHDDLSAYVHRVPGGWVFMYGHYGNIFVPFDNEFQGKGYITCPKCKIPVYCELLHDNLRKCSKCGHAFRVMLGI